MLAYHGWGIMVRVLDLIEQVIGVIAALVNYHGEIAQLRVNAHHRAHFVWRNIAEFLGDEHQSWPALAREHHGFVGMPGGAHRKSVAA